MNAVIEHKVQTEAEKIRSETTKQRLESEQQKAARDWQAKIEAANIPDYADVVKDFEDNFPITPAIAQAIMSDDKGPQLAYYLAKHLDKADEIISMNPVNAAMELGKISARLSAVKPKTKTQALDPVKPIKPKAKVPPGS